MQPYCCCHHYHCFCCHWASLFFLLYHCLVVFCHDSYCFCCHCPSANQFSPVQSTDPVILQITLYNDIKRALPFLLHETADKYQLHLLQNKFCLALWSHSVPYCMSKLQDRYPDRCHWILQFHWVNHSFLVNWPDDAGAPFHHCAVKHPHWEIDRPQHWAPSDKDADTIKESWTKSFFL